MDEVISRACVQLQILTILHRFATKYSFSHFKEVVDPCSLSLTVDLKYHEVVNEELLKAPLMDDVITINSLPTHSLQRSRGPLCLLKKSPI